MRENPSYLKIYALPAGFTDKAYFPNIPDGENINKMFTRRQLCAGGTLAGLATGDALGASQTPQQHLWSTALHGLPGLTGDNPVDLAAKMTINQGLKLNR